MYHRDISWLALTVSILAISGFSTGEKNFLGCLQKAVLEDLYLGLHTDITKQSCVGLRTGEQHLVLLDAGIPLLYENFNPRKPTRFAQPGTLPQFVTENAMPLIDKIFPTGVDIKPLPMNSSHSIKDYHFDSLSSTFDFVLSHMMVSPRNFSDQEVLRAKYYLQELVPNPELVLQNKSDLPRFLLYDFYRSHYLQEKEKKDQAITKNRASLTRQAFEDWGQKELPALESNSEAAFKKWQIFGYKADVEKQLQYFDIDVHEDKLMSTHALFKSMERPSQRDPHVTVYPFTFSPENWYKVLQRSIAESSDELRYRKSLLLAQQALMNATKNDLSDDTNEDIKRTQELIEKNLAELRVMIQNAVDKLLQMEVECFTHANLSVCADIIDGHTAFRYLLQNVSQHFSQASYLESVIEGRAESIAILQQKLSEVQADVKSLDLQISSAEKREKIETIDLSTSQNNAVTSCPEAGRIHFTFNSKNTHVDENECEDSNTAASEDTQSNCTDYRIPVNATKQQLWNLRSCSVDNDLKAFKLYSSFTKLMNSATAKVSASLHKVDIQRPWFDITIFEDSDHYTMKRGRGVVSPGPLEPDSYFHQIARSGMYLMPQFISSFILASDVTVFFPQLGTWNDSDGDNTTNGAIHVLMKYAYAPNLAGGYGPFNFAPANGVQNVKHNFRVERKSGGIQISIPGGQIVGYVTTVVPKFPSNQSKIPDPPQSCMKKPTELHSRRRRSTSDNSSPSGPNIQDLVGSLFSNSFHRSTQKHGGVLSLSTVDVGVLPSEALEKLMQESDATKEEVQKFIEMFEKDDMEETGRVLPLIHNPRSGSVNNNNTVKAAHLSADKSTTE